MNINQKIRQQIIQQRKQLSSDFLQQSSQQLFRQIQPILKKFKTPKIASYLAVNGEIDLTPLHQYLHQQGLAVFLPIIQQQKLAFSAWQKGQLLRNNKFNIPEPDPKFTTLIEPLDIIFIPLVAFKTDCNRMGMGGGFYDRTLASIDKQKHPLLIGVGYEFQKNEHFQVHHWDVQLDRIITPDNIYQKSTKN